MTGLLIFAAGHLLLDIAAVVLLGLPWDEEFKGKTTWKYLGALGLLLTPIGLIWASIDALL